MTKHAPTITDLPTPDALPEDPAALRALVIELLALIAKQAGDIDGLQRNLRSLLRRHVGPKADRIDDHQLLLFATSLIGGGEASVDDSEAVEPSEPSDQETPEPLPAALPAPTTGRGGNKRKPLPSHLPRERVVHRPPEADEPCPCCGMACVKIGEEITETLDYVPASLRVREDVREKFACVGCRESGVAIAELPPRPLHRGRYAAGFIAWVVVSKYADHLPLYRLVQIAKRQRVELAISTLVDILALAAGLLRGIVEAMREEMLAGPIIHTDDTSMPVIVGRGPAHKGRIRVYVGVDEHADFTHIVFQFNPTGEGIHSQKWLEGYRGTLCADGAQVNDALYRAGVTEAGCLAHLRRYFIDAQHDAPLPASIALAFIKRIYDVEKQARKARMTPDERLALRQRASKPIVEALYGWIDAEKLTVRPTSALAAALRYAHNQRAPCTRFLDDGRLDVDNNISERELRGPVLGRKNYKVTGSLAAAERYDDLYSVLASCRLAGVDPFAWTRDVLARVLTHPQNRLIDLAPRYWQPRE